jgi:hypothetical protein
MKHFTLKFFWGMVVALLGFSNSFATSGANGAITLCLFFTSTSLHISKVNCGG